MMYFFNQIFNYKFNLKNNTEITNGSVSSLKGSSKLSPKKSWKSVLPKHPYQ